LIRAAWLVLALGLAGCKQLLPSSYDLALAGHANPFPVIRYERRQHHDDINVTRAAEGKPPLRPSTRQVTTHWVKVKAWLYLQWDF
jgi:hypothetical protein